MPLHLNLLIVAIIGIAHSSPLYQSQSAQQLLVASSNNAATLSSQAAQAAAATANLASALSYPWSSADATTLSDWCQFASGAWGLGAGANWDLWASKQFNNEWCADLSAVETAPSLFQLPSWVDSSSQNLWNIWAQVLSAQPTSYRGRPSTIDTLSANSLLGGVAQAQNVVGLANGLSQNALSNQILTTELAWSSSSSNGGGWAQDSNGYWYQDLNGQLYQGTQGPWNGYTNGWNQDSATGLWWLANANPKAEGWARDAKGFWVQNSGNGRVWAPTVQGPWNGYVNGWGQDASDNWYQKSSVVNQWNDYKAANNVVNQQWNQYATVPAWSPSANGYGYGGGQNGWYAGSVDGSVGAPPSGSGPWTGSYQGWSLNGNGVWFNRDDPSNGWYQDQQSGSWYMTPGPVGNSNSWYNGNSNVNNWGQYSEAQPTGAGPWNGYYQDWTQNNGVWNNGGNSWYQDNSGVWYSNGNNGGAGYSGYSNVGAQPSGSGPWNGYYQGWTQTNGVWYNGNDNGNGNGWYQDNSGAWYTNGYYGNNNNNNNGIGYSGYSYVGAQPTGTGPWNGYYQDWTQTNGVWYNGNGNGWYQDNSGAWYTNGYYGNNNNNNNGVGYSGYSYVGAQPTGTGPWNGYYQGWTQKNGVWYNGYGNGNGNGNGWYQDNNGAWYTNGYYGSNNNNNNGVGYSGSYVGAQPTGSGPWNGYYQGWTQTNGVWYNPSGQGWYQDGSGGWYSNYLGYGQAADGGVGDSRCVTTFAGQTNATVSCSAGLVIQSVFAAAYGSNPGSCPASVATAGAQCTLNVTQLIQRTCQGQNQCSVTVSPSILGAPTNNGQQCTVSGGAYSINNQYTLAVQYACGIAGPGSAALNSTLGGLSFLTPNSAPAFSVAAATIATALAALAIVV